MGSRIHKILGYALTDVKCNKKGKIIDKRINTEILDAEIEFTTKNLIDYVKQNPSIDFKHLHINMYRTDKELEQKYDSYNVIKSNTEYGLKNVLMITIPWNKDWNRYDDIIDYCEENGGTAKIKPIWGDIFPYGGRWINNKTKKEYTHTEFSPCVVHKYLFEKTDLSKTYFIDKFGTANKKILKDNLHTIAPDIIKLLCQYLNIFKDINTYKELKPSIYTYWS